MRTVIVLAISLFTSTANAFVTCRGTDSLSLRQREMDEFCLPDDMKRQHDAECMSLGVAHDTERYFTCRKSKAELYRNNDLLKQIMERDSRPPS
jgi:hypothetical protein